MGRICHWSHLCVPGKQFNFVLTKDDFVGRAYLPTISQRSSPRHLGHWAVYLRLVPCELQEHDEPQLQRRLTLWRRQRKKKESGN